MGIVECTLKLNISMRIKLIMPRATLFLPVIIVIMISQTQLNPKYLKSFFGKQKSVSFKDLMEEKKYQI